jgi:hypothetical protein
MHSKSSFSAFPSRPRGITTFLKGLSLIGLASLAFSFLHCDSSTSPAPVATADTIKILSPVKGASLKLTDTALIILKIDTTLFNRTGLYLSFSTDSGKCWAVDCMRGGSLPPYKIKPGKGAVRLDTIKWVPADYPFAEAGNSVKLKLIDYPPSTILRMTDYFTFTN